MAAILFPTDFSDVSLNAFVYGIQFANKSNRSIDVLHVYQRPDISGVNLPNTLQEVYDSIDIEEFDNFREMVPKLRDIVEKYKMGHLEMKHLMIEGEVVSTIHGIAKKEGAELIIMGTKGTSGLKEKLFGSITRKVIEKVEVDVLSIPEEAQFDGNIDRLVFLTNYYEEERAALDKLIKLANEFEAEIHCIHLERGDIDSSQYMEEWKKGLISNNKIHFEIIKTDDLEAGLSSYCEAHQTDIVAMPASSSSFLERWFGYSLDRNLTFHLKTPLLHIHT